MDKQLLIIGNGFDLHCGLKSGYYDFYESEIKNKFNDYDQNEPKDFWHILLTKYESNAKDFNWCDIESIIKETLQAINVLDDSSNSIASRTDLFNKAWIEMIDALNNSIPLNNYKDNSNQVTPFINKYCRNYNLKMFYDTIKNEKTLYNQAPSFAKDKFNEHLLDELKKLERLFCEYLRKQIIEYIDYSKNSTNLLLKLFYLGKLPIDEIERKSALSQYNFMDKSVLSFNYTLPFTEINRLKSYSNVHGKLCDDSCATCTSSTTIFGIDDKLVWAKENNNLRIFSKTYRTLFSNEDTKSALPYCDINNPLIIKFYGHSLAEADYSYFQSIFDYYNLYNNSNVSLVFYYTPYKEGIKNITTDAVYNLINQYGLTLSNKDQGKNLMHKLILEKRVKINEIE